MSAAADPVTVEVRITSASTSLVLSSTRPVPLLDLLDSVTAWARQAVTVPAAGNPS